MELFGIHFCPHCIIQAFVIIKDDFVFACKYYFALLTGKFV